MADKTAGTAKPSTKTTPRPATRRPASRALRYEFLVAAIVMAAAICVLYPELVFQDRVFFGGDSQAAMSFSRVGEQTLKEGGYPLWNPYLFAGMPSYASLSYTPYVYPVVHVVGLLSRFLFFPKAIWLLFHTWLIGIGVWLLLRERGIQWAASIPAGVAMMWIPNLVAVGAHGHGSQASASAFLPLALYFWDRVWRGKGLLVNGAALSIVLGMSMLRAHLQISYYTYLLLGLHLIFFGAARVMEASRGTIPADSVLPRRWFDRVTAARSRYSAANALGECGYAVVVLGVVVGISLLISAVLYIPVHDYAQYSIRGASEGGGLNYGYATGWSLHPLETLTFVMPFAFGFGKDLYFGHMPFTDYPNYLGIVVFLLAVTALIRARTRFLWFLLFVAIFSTVVSFGRFFPVLYGPMFKFVPYFSKFRVPVMILIVQQVAVVLMAGIGLDALLRAEAARGRQWAVKGLAAVFVVFMILVLSQGFWSSEFAEAIRSKMHSGSTPQEQLLVAKSAGTYLRNDLMRLCVMTALFFVVMFLFFNGRWMRPALAGALVFVLIAVDLYSVDQKVLHPDQFRQYEGFRLIQDRSVVATYNASDEMIDFLKRDASLYRVFPIDQPQAPFGQLFASNRFMNFGISSLGGYHAAKLSLYEDYLSALNQSLARGRFDLVDMMNARYLVCGAPLPEHPRFNPVWQGKDFEGQPRFVYENMGAMPRAWFVDGYRVVPGADALAEMVSGGIDLRKEAFLDRQPAIQPVAVDSASAEITSHSFNRMTLRASTPQPALLVVSEVYYPDWKVTIDGADAEMLRANHILRAVVVPAGEHEISMSYDSSSLVRTALVSGGTLAVVLLALLGHWISFLWRRNRGSARLRTNV